MKIIIDLSSAQPQGSMIINGGGEYAVVLLKQLYQALTMNDQLDIILNSKLGRNEVIEGFACENNICILKYDSVEHFSLILTKRNYDQLILPICYYKYGALKVKSATRIVSAIHDLCDIYYYGKLKVKYGRYPQLDKLNWIRKIRDKFKAGFKYKECILLYNNAFKINNNQMMYTVTYYTKNTFSYFLDVENLGNINVYYTPEFHKEPVERKIQKSILKKYNLEPKKYFMLSAGCRWTKNNAIVLFVLDKLFSNPKYQHILKDFKVIQFGVDEKYKKYYEYNIKNKDKFLFDGFVDNNTIETLYEYAHMFIFPSILEGFGQPPIEAMKYGTIAACSTSMSIPEVCGEAVIYFDPYNEDSISLAILRGFDSEYISKLREKARIHLQELNVRRNEDMKRLVDSIINYK